MRYRSTLISLVIFLVFESFASQLHAQCPFEWRPGDGVPGTNGQVNASTIWDPDGLGPQIPLLVLGGSFSVAGDTAANNVAAWDGTSWTAFGMGTNDEVRALAVYDGNLIAADMFERADNTDVDYIAQWDGKSWTPLEGGG